jgi:hypothetical protein
MTTGLSKLKYNQIWSGCLWTSFSIVLTSEKYICWFIILASYRTPDFISATHQRENVQFASGKCDTYILSLISNTMIYWRHWLMTNPCLCDFRGRSILVGFKKKKNPDLPTLILKTMQSKTHIFFFWPHICHLINIHYRWFATNFRILPIYFFFGIKNLRVGGKILGSIGNTHIFFFARCIHIMIYV